LQQNEFRVNLRAFSAKVEYFLLDVGLPHRQAEAMLHARMEPAARRRFETLEEH